MACLPCQKARAQAVTAAKALDLRAFSAAVIQGGRIIAEKATGGIQKATPYKRPEE